METFLTAKIVDEKKNKEFITWYSVDKQYGTFLSNECADAFVLLMLHIAMKSGQDIVSEAPVSGRLLFNIENTIQPLFLKSIPDLRHINISAQVKHFVESGTAVGCGCSLGVDSFSSFLKHFEGDVVEGYKVTHLTLFNCGQLGDRDLVAAEKNLRDTVNNLRPFADEVGLPIVAVNSNLNELYLDGDVTLLQSFICRTASCALALQKLFGKYVYSSSYSVENFQISGDDESHMEAVFVPLLGTENLEFILSNPCMTRVEKTEYLSRFNITKKYLDVCWAAQFANSEIKGTDFFTKEFVKNMKKKNCGRCEKCMRTILTLDLFGRLQDFEGVFDLDYYKDNKDLYIYRCIRDRKENVFWNELANIIEKKNIPITWKAKIYLKNDFFSRICRCFYEFMRKTYSYLRSKN